MAPETLLSSLVSFNKAGNFPKDVVHPFAAGGPDTCDLLQDLVNTTEQLTQTLQKYDASTSTPWATTKLASLLRQHSTIEDAYHSSNRNILHLMSLLKSRDGIYYGENIPALTASLADWCIEQLVSWGRSVGMESFRDDDGRSTVVLAGKVLVIDIDFTIERETPLTPTLKVSNVKTSNALLPGASSSMSILLDTFLRETMSQYCAEMQRNEELRDASRVAFLRRSMLGHLRYLVLLDRLASKEDGGIRWFSAIDELCPKLVDIAKNEAESVASSLGLAKSPLDVFLLRSHSLPIPYYTAPSISFLVHLSASAYLTLLRNATNPPTGDNALPLDLATEDLRANLKNIKTGVTQATLILDQMSDANLYPLLVSMPMPNTNTRPSFPLCPKATDFDLTFPQLNGFGLDAGPPGLTNSDDSKAYCWVLDFTDGGRRPGVVMAQSRIKAIELVVNPLGGGSDLDPMADVLSIGSWVDLLVNPGNTISSERYTAVYKSPNNLHPPLQLRLRAPEEPGYVLERIPVHNMREVWGILELVREQCWLNETLLGCQWTAEGLQVEKEEIPESPSVTENDLAAVLAGTFTPRSIPVNISLRQEGIFSTGDLNFSPGPRPQIVMSAPELAPVTGLVEITVTYDETKPRGVSVDVQGALGLEADIPHLEEICRRGGILGLPGRLRAATQNTTATW